MLTLLVNNTQKPNPTAVVLVKSSPLSLSHLCSDVGLHFGRFQDSLRAQDPHEVTDPHFRLRLLYQAKLDLLLFLLLCLSSARDAVGETVPQQALAQNETLPKIRLTFSVSSVFFSLSL